MINNALEFQESFAIAYMHNVANGILRVILLSDLNGFLPLWQLKPEGFPNITGDETKINWRSFI